MLLLALLCVDVGLTFYAVYHAPFPAIVPLGAPTAYLNIYVHIPIAWASYMLFTVAFIAAILFLIREKEYFDRLVYGFALVGVVYAGLTLVTGSAWASESWGSPWNWDPRETAVLLLFLAYLVYFGIRASIPDPDRAARLSSVYAVAAYSMVPISFIAPKIAGTSLHPTIKATAAFFARPEVMSIFIPKTVVSMAIAFILGLYAARRLRPEFKGVPKIARIILVAIVLLGAIACGLSLQPYATGHVVRVISAKVTSQGLISELVLANGEKIVYTNPVPSPIKPAIVEGRPTIVGNLVVALKNGVILVRHWSVGLNSILYFVTIAILTALVTRPKPRIAE